MLNTRRGIVAALLAGAAVYGLYGALASSDAQAGSPKASIPLPTEALRPVLAWYYPQFSQGLDTDVRNAAAATIDALIVSETGMSDLAPYLAAGQRGGVNIVLGVEPQLHPSAEALEERLRGVLSGAAAQPAYLTYAGKPVVVFWRPHAVPRFSDQSAQQTWLTLRHRVDPNRASVWIGEGGDPTSSLSYLSAFDGIYLYSISWADDPAAQLASWADRVRSVDLGKLWVATAMAGGYYGSGSDRAEWQYRDRANGDYYRAAWRGAIASNPAMVVITSFNETAEATEIHPTPEWGTAYLDITREMAGAWRSGN